MHFIFLLNFLLIFLLLNNNNVVKLCSVTLTADHIPTNAGISNLPNPSTYGVYAPAGYSEVVQITNMQGLPLPPWQRVNCPHLQNNLTPFLSIISKYKSGMNVTIPAGSNVLLSNSSLGVAILLLI